MSKILSEIEAWFSDRPKWLQDGARRLIQSGELTDADIEELINLCKAEASMDTTTIKPRGIPSGDLNFKEEIINLSLKSISNLIGINALSPRKPLKFGEGPITIIYGQNGSGKSGYVRVLKHACGAKNPGKLLSNVFTGTSTKQGCTFSIANDSTTKDIEWNSMLGVHDELRAVELYDSECANLYVNDENEVAYEPWILSLFSQLTEVCDQVGQALKEESSKLISKKPKLPDSYATTEAGAWYNKLTSTTKETDVEVKCKWSSELENEILLINKRLSEANPADKAKKLRKTKTSAENFSKNLENIKDNLKNAKCDSFLLAKADALAKRRAVDEDVKKVFEGAPLTGVGCDTYSVPYVKTKIFSFLVNQIFPIGI